MMARPSRLAKKSDEIERNFRHSFQALRLSSKAYDEGFRGEAARLAGVIYIFVHDHGKRTVSLLSLVSGKEIPFRNTAVPLNPRNLLTEMPLVMQRVGPEGFEYIPILDKGPAETLTQPDQPFRMWWDAPVFRDKKLRILTRKNFVFSMRHGEGGGHVSPDLDEMFADLRRNNSAGWTFVAGDKSFVPEYGPEYATVRQIAFELYQTLLANFSDILGPGLP